jgi:hypothetical protein
MSASESGSGHSVEEDPEGNEPGSDGPGEEGQEPHSDDEGEEDYNDDDASLPHEDGEEDEEEYMEEDEEDEEDADASEHSDKRQRVDSGGTSRVAELEAENENLKRELATLRNDVIPKLLEIKSGQESLIRVFGAYSSSAMGVPLPTDTVNDVTEVAKSVKLIQVFGIGHDEIMLRNAIDDIPAPARFKASGSFPQAIAIDSRTQQRQYQVESRRPTCIRFRLVNKLDGRRANERDLCPDGMLPFRMSMRFADNNEEVSDTAFERLTETTFTKPPLDQINVRQMANGEVMFNIARWDCTSNDSSPKSRSFVICVYPEHPDHAHNMDLMVTTPAFQIRSKVTAK